MLLTADTVVTGRDVLRPGWVEVGGSVITAVGAGMPANRITHNLGAVTIVPGFVDTHVHGGGGFDFSAATLAATSTVADLHRRHGTTRLIASLVSADPGDLLRQVSTLAEYVQSDLIAGVHLEGPWLAQSRCGAHNAAVLRNPAPEEVGQLLAAGRGTIRMITLAPELPGAIDTINRIVDAGAVAAVGHTDASYRETVAAIAAGATVGTHLFNAMRPIHHREPGPVVALLEDPRVTVEFIGDDVHVSSALYRHVNSFGIQRVSLITDAMSACGVGDGTYRLGSLDVEVCNDIARVAGTETIAGSTATMDRAFRYSVAHSGLDTDAALLLAVQQTSVNPARALSLPGSSLGQGEAADLVILDSNLHVQDVLCGGAWVSTDGLASNH